MNTERIMLIQKQTAYPDSESVMQALLQVWNECSQGTKSVDCDECANIGSVCNKCIYNKFTDDYFKQKEKQWYEKPESFPCLCLVGDTYPNDMNTVSLTTGYEPENSYPFIAGGSIGWKYAAPLTKSELLEYCLEEK